MIKKLKTNKEIKTIKFWKHRDLKETFEEYKD